MDRTAAYQHVAQTGVDGLVREYLPLVKQIALRLAARLPASVELDDLMQAGLIGLLQAREQHDPEQGASFATYAGIRIKGAMLDELRGSDWLPRSVQSNLSRVAQAINSVSLREGRPAREAEIAAELSLSLEDYQSLAGELACARMCQLDDDVASSAGDEHGDPLRQVGEAGFHEALQQAVAQLPEKEQLMMSLYYGDGLNLKEIGLVLGVSESRVSQLHGQAVARLRITLEAWKE
ncbi:MAG: RNA polymerase sigma factor FliA [Haliea sp.]|uniref:RNA polymerase sigma factor FliA n=1 Tax=Haliea sp. TaxID=1932666 RepID=UPI000C584276|nr:RNA polymerase sigma factor FliA [Haliea sp.]MBM70488.1 RNA polymerase sigma factor FliA [Haliea sp.]|tara:strand:+ start:61065 stop:61772 length:708 start_codon:yes stop_codon:yes gene_type:complete